MGQSGAWHLMVDQGQADGHLNCCSSFFESLKFFKAKKLREGGIWRDEAVQVAAP